MHSILCAVVVFCVIGCSFGQLPVNERCNAGDVKCISRVASEIIAKYPNGRPEIGIPPLEPFRLSSIIVEPEPNTQLMLRLELNDLVIHGLSKTKIEKIVGFEKNPSTSKFELYAKVPKIRFQSKYKSDGRVLIVPVNGKGHLDLNMTDVKLSIKFKPKVLQKQGKTYIDIDKMKIKIEPGPSRIHFESSVNGGALGESLNAFLNENWNELWKEIYPAFNNALLRIIKNILHDILEKVAYDDLYIN